MGTNDHFIPGYIFHGADPEVGGYTLGTITINRNPGQDMEMAVVALTMFKNRMLQKGYRAVLYPQAIPDKDNQSCVIISHEYIAIVLRLDGVLSEEAFIQDMRSSVEELDSDNGARVVPFPSC